MTRNGSSISPSQGCPDTLQINRQARNSGAVTRRTDRLPYRSPSRPQTFRNARLESWLITFNRTTRDIGKPSVRSMYTVRNGDARLAEKLHIARNATSRRKLPSWNGSVSSRNGRNFSAGGAIGGSGVRARI